ncbi:putative amino acid permease YfnA [Phytophthora cinnamomi]|uniref:putative amino acid permease YfnA n=1 Tax=Phytophthora cinnamomi TaxID=4785 RepID=UPI0035593999|nr:putative amino acid permease YfnA [Phytophthora cinnamomi]
MDIYLLGISIAIGGQYFGWNSGVSAGIYSLLIAYIIIASGYITLCSCLAEINGALPFAGGAYGLARCTLGFYPAFMIGCCDALEYTAYVSAGVLAFTDLLAEAIPAILDYRPLLWAIFYLTALALNIKGDRVFWLVNRWLGITSLVVLAVFCFGSLPYVNFDKYAAKSDIAVVGDFTSFMNALPLIAWFFIGAESLTLASDNIENPKKIIPAAQISCISTLVTTGIVVFFVTISLPPGVSTLATEPFPFCRGFQLIFNTSHGFTSILSMPATLAKAVGFMWCYGKIIYAMSASHLLLPIFSTSTKSNGMPYAALLLGSICSYGFCIIVYIFPILTAELFRVCILSASVSYTGQCIGYISLKWNHKNIKSSSFSSPFGIWGAFYSMVIWIFTAIALIGFQDDSGVALIAFLLMVLALSTYYFAYARKQQTFSAQENKVMLIAHVTKFNIKKVAASRQKRTSHVHAFTASRRTNTDTSQVERSKRIVHVSSANKSGLR